MWHLGEPHNNCVTPKDKWNMSKWNGKEISYSNPGGQWLVGRQGVREISVCTTLVDGVTLRTTVSQY